MNHSNIRLSDNDLISLKKSLKKYKLVSISTRPDTFVYQLKVSILTNSRRVAKIQELLDSVLEELGYIKIANVIVDGYFLTPTCIYFTVIKI